ncbi:V-type proton ATPase subunit E [Senna tora]|uniref:V-type proton ATPase subunit E n=1 Tax=Senna tora TaxID=362788 RepID=A0A834WFR2_9FABA|nr:V-type proton ATPase subunit E [Senna tora]
MNDADVSKKIQQMVRFIRQEAEEKANEIGVSADADVSIHDSDLFVFSFELVGKVVKIIKLIPFKSGDEPHQSPGGQNSLGIHIVHRSSVQTPARLARLLHQLLLLAVVRSQQAMPQNPQHGLLQLPWQRDPPFQFLHLLLLHFHFTCNFFNFGFFLFFFSFFFFGDVLDRFSLRFYAVLLVHAPVLTGPDLAKLAEFDFGFDGHLGDFGVVEFESDAHDPRAARGSHGAVGLEGGGDDGEVRDGDGEGLAGA